jgi:uncharacterized protein
MQLKTYVDRPGPALPEPLPARAPDAFHLLVRPTGAACNLGCKYCFYLPKEKFYAASRFRMTDELLELYIKQLLESHSEPRVAVAWTGGEPTLMGLDFYRQAIACQEKYRRPGMTFENTMQTNGTQLDDAWCEFFKENNFLIGISIDGPRELHDIHRVDKAGQPTFDRVMRGLRLLQKHGVEYNVLVTVNRVTGDYPREIYRFLRDEAGTDWIQLIPVVERMNAYGVNLVQMGNKVSSRSVHPEQFGRFLIGVFDEWVHNDVGKVFVQTFEATLRNWMGLHSGMCVFDPTCGYGLAMEHNGDLYGCDHFVEPDYLLGNISETHMIELISSDRQYKFGQDKFDRLPRACLECPVLFACHGGCPKNRFMLTPDGQPGLNYLCAGYKAFFRRVDEPMRFLAMMISRSRLASDAMPILSERKEMLSRAYRKAQPEESCPCGSGLTFSACHGWKRPEPRR